ncbi:MAG: hypothetical protein ACI89L_002564 [Phycisphaerales bacterium]|jgi:hypothetical protein
MTAPKPSDPTHPLSTTPTTTKHAAHPAPLAIPGVVERRRDLFWQNVVRESLMALAAAAQSGGRTSPTPSGAAHSPKPVGDLFDGRIAIITQLGQRIPVADIYPVFSCSISGSPVDRLRSADIQCTVFRITSPLGETFTLPISQISMIHSLSDDLIQQLENAAEAQAAAMEEEDEEGLPFGFAAYTSLSASEAESDPLGPAI